MDKTDAPNMQSYPSPNAGAADSSGPFYSTSSNQQQPGLAHTDELQLADLSRGLAPIMHAGQSGSLPDGQDPRSQGAMNHHYDSEGHQQGHMQAGHATMDQMGGQFGTPDGSMAPRKRSKVSRACDECRRKKIRCDATGEEGKELCSNCKRVGSRCQFSRVPMKRGPSKGYIKELADRLNTLEGVMQASELPVQQQYMQHHDTTLQRHGSDEFSPPPNPDGSPRKRTYSSISGEFSTPYQPQRSQAREWASQEQPRHLPHPSSTFATPQTAPPAANMFREPNYSPNGLQPVPQWRNAPEPPHRQGSSFDSNVQAEHGHTDYAVEWNEGLVETYYKAIHPTYPLLPHSKARLNSRLANCPPALQDAFYESLYAAARSFSTSVATAEHRGSKNAAQILALQFDTSAVSSASTNLVYLQTLLLMAIEAENHGPLTKGQTGPSQSVWLGSAVGLAYSMKLHVHKTPDKQSENDADSDDKIARRIWWTLVMMDRWHSSSTSSPVLIPDGSVIVFPEDQALLGDTLYHVARLSIVLGHFSAVQIAPTDVPAFAVPPTSMSGMLLRGELERCRESFPLTFFPPSNAPLIHLCYWYLRILLELRLCPSEPEDILGPAMHIVTQLTHNTSFISPLTHHATVLAASTLIELTSYDNTKDTAENGLRSLVENHIAPSGWDIAIRDLIVSKRNLGLSAGAGGAESQHALTASQGLQRLADLATATEEDRVDATTVESRKEGEQTNQGPAGNRFAERLQGLRDLITKGYMSALSS